LAQTLKTRAFCTGATLLNAALQYLSIVFSFCAGVWLFGEPVTLSAISGMLLVVLAGFAAALVGEPPLPRRLARWAIDATDASPRWPEEGGQ
jgi:S-adenosylmethionine uptake transporter